MLNSNGSYHYESPVIWVYHLFLHLISMIIKYGKQHFLFTEGSEAEVVRLHFFPQIHMLTESGFDIKISDSKASFFPIMPSLKARTAFYRQTMSKDSILSVNCI